MPAEVEAYLRSLNTSDRARAAAWDAVYSVKDDTEAQRLLASLPFNDDTKATLWDARKGMAPEVAQPQAQAAPTEQPSAASRFFSNAGAVLNPIEAVKGIWGALPVPQVLGGSGVVDGPVNTIKNIYHAQAEQFGKAREDFSQGRYGEAVRHGAASALPILGPAADAAHDKMASGDVAGGLGTMAGLMTGTALTGPGARAAGTIARPALQAGGRRLYQSALKPNASVLKDVRPRAGLTPRETLLQTGLDEGIPITARGARKAETLIDSLNAEVRARVDTIQARGEKVDPALVERAIDDVVRDFTNQVNAQPDLSAIAAVRENFRQNPNVAQTVAPAQPANFASGQIQGRAAQTQPGPIDPVVAQQMKTNTYQGLRGKYDKDRGATIEAEKAGARGLRQGIEEAGARAGVSDIAAVNAREGALISLEHALSDAMRRRGNYDALGLKPTIGIAGAAASESVLPLLATLVDRFPALVSRSGIWINRAGRTGRAAGAGGRATVVGTTTPTESRNRTTAPAWLGTQPAR